MVQAVPGREGKKNERDQLTDRREFSHESSPNRGGWQAQRSLLPEAAGGTGMLMSGQGSEWGWEMGTGRKGQRPG